MLETIAIKLKETNSQTGLIKKKASPGRFCDGYLVLQNLAVIEIVHLCPNPLFRTRCNDSGKLLVSDAIHEKQLFPHKSDFSFESHLLRIEIEVAKYLGLMNISLRIQENEPL